MKIALIQDWLLGMRGGEKVLESLCRLYPEADIHTLLYDPKRVSPLIRARSVKSSWLESFPFVHNYYRYLLPLMPTAIESLDIKDYDLVISSSHCVAKGVRAASAKHISYCHTPMRYIYYQEGNYFPGGA